MSREEDAPRGREPSFFRQREQEPVSLAPGLAPGRVVGDFRLVALIGQGGMGQVWEAEQLSLRRRVAVKFVRPERVTAKQLELFAREARAGGRLSHPGIVGVHEHGTSDGLAWIAMEHVAGAWTLRDFLDEVARASETPRGYDRHVARFVAEVADAMQAAHEAGVIHRDLKPQNILVTADDHPKVTDFGLARITDETALSLTGDFAGTYYYMSPEQVTAKRIAIDHRSDVFSLGVVLYELLALRRPFEGDTTHQVAEQIVMQDPPDPRAIRSKVPRDLAVIASKALEKSRDKRFQTMAELAADLRRYLADEPIRARPPGALERALKWARRNPAKSSVAAVVLAALVVISSLLLANLRANRELAGSNTALAAKTVESEARRVEAERAAAAERQRAEEVLRLSDVQELEELERAAEALWPVRPDVIASLQDWIARAQRLVDALPAHRLALAELRSRSPAAEGATSALGERQARWWEGQFDGLIAEIERLERGLLAPDAIVEGRGPSIPSRLALAERLRGGFAPGGEHRAAWERALPAIRSAYPGLSLAPQMGLVPLGPDPSSGLWEFGDLQTGELPRRGDDGRLVIGDATGLVFVLLQGGTFTMGSQRSDPSAPNHDSRGVSDEEPPREVTLSPFFLSKHEMTQGQWLRVTGSRPSAFGPLNFDERWMRRRLPIGLLHPVEKVSWSACAVVCERLGLMLPSEAQWEYAVRGGTSSPWWIGEEPDGLAETANVLDEYARTHGASRGSGHAPWDDGATVHAPIGSYLPNPFGLHEMLGNVYEWCLDGYAVYGAVTGPDPVAPPSDSRSRVRRGGSFGVNPDLVRSACRGRADQDAASDDCGLRPARRIE
jgi:formylglycine-generating enzyme required for sulfatase activity